MSQLRKGFMEWGRGWGRHFNAILTQLQDDAATCANQQSQNGTQSHAFVVIGSGLRRGASVFFSKEGKRMALDVMSFQFQLSIQPVPCPFLNFELSKLFSSIFFRNLAFTFFFPFIRLNFMLLLS